VMTNPFPNPVAFWGRDGGGAPDGGVRRVSRNGLQPSDEVIGSIIRTCA